MAIDEPALRVGATQGEQGEGYTTLSHTLDQQAQAHCVMGAQASERAEHSTSRFAVLSTHRGQEVASQSDAPRAPREVDK